MQVFGNIATPVEKRQSKSGKDYFTFRLAENQGKDEYRTTTWYDVSAFISELDADLLAQGQFVKVTGRLEVKPFQRKNGELAASATILAYSIEPVQRKEKTDGSGAPAQGSAPAQRQEAPANRPAAPAPRQAAQAPVSSGFDDMDDDIPF